MEHSAYEKPEPGQSWNFLDVILISVGAVVLFVAGFLLLRWLPIPRPDGDNISILLAVAFAALEAMALIGSIFLFGVFRRRMPWTSLGLRPAPMLWWLVAFFAGLIITPLAGMIALTIRLTLGLPLENPQLPFLLPEDLNLWGALSMILLGGLVVPFAEELFFRGLIYSWIRDRLGVWMGIGISALIFGLIHLELSVAGTAFILGLLLAWIYERSGSLWPAVLIHAMNNTVQILLLYVLVALGFTIPGA